MRRLLLWAGLLLLLSPGNGKEAVFPLSRVQVLTSEKGNATYKLVCYYTEWARVRVGLSSVLPSDLDATLCTHMILAFASMDNNQLVGKNPEDEETLYPEFNKLKEKNKELKTLLSIGGWNFGTTRFTTMLSAQDTREIFIDSAIKLLRKYDFDGLDLTFLYPGLRGSPESDRENLLLLVEELLAAFQKESLVISRPRLLLSAAVSGDPKIIEKAYDVPNLGRFLDFISVLSYDLHGSWEKVTGHNSPLFSLPGDTKSTAFCMAYWKSLGAPAEKLIMGLPTYGRSFRLLEASENGLQANAVGPATPGKYTKHPGFLAYYEICPFLRRATKRWIGFQYVPYAYKGMEWVGYDNAISFSYKASFIKKGHFGGAMVWTLDLDDFKGTFCGAGQFPLIHTLNSILLKPNIKASPSPRSQLSSSVNYLRASPGRHMVTAHLGSLSPRKEALATKAHRQSKDMTSIYRGQSVAPTSFEKQSVVLNEKTEMPTEMMTLGNDQSLTPGGISMSSVELPTLTFGGTTMASREDQSVTPGETSMSSDELETMILGGTTVNSVNPRSLSPREMPMSFPPLWSKIPRNILSLRNKTVAYPKVTPHSRKKAVTHNEQTKTLRREDFEY
ncbi:oviduct-specific glycoprotein isoform X1 [Erinaceus europaeus]|uniref:Oviduct-specific glycoprotein n=1 Tax=Erinaceus europaeus TaxID=9365 RepID=A0ABM3Y9X3_ERIEU|nr:oviduct-specific glycoprotein isoform X1 [Erinaceus europaeus]